MTGVAHVARSSDTRVRRTPGRGWTDRLALCPSGANVRLEQCFSSMLRTSSGLVRLVGGGTAPEQPERSWIRSEPPWDRAASPSPLLSFWKGRLAVACQLVSPVA